jgi:hypothetical protein
MPQSTEGVLLVIGALFFLIGLLGGGFEVSAIKIPPIEKYPRAVLFGMGIILLLAGLFRILFPATPVVVPAANTSVAVVTLPPPTQTPLSPSATPPPPTSTPPPPPATPLPPTATPPPATVTATVVTPTSPPTATPTLAVIATIQDVSSDYDVTKFGQKGMLIHVKFLVNGMKDLKGRLIAYFSDQGGQQLTSHDSKDLTADGLFKFQATDGQLIVWDYFTPIYDAAQLSDFQLFLPYSAIELSAGTYHLQFSTKIMDLRNSSQPLAVAPDFLFSFTTQ